MRKVGESQVQGHFWLHREVKTSLGYIRLTRKIRKKKEAVSPPPPLPLQPAAPEESGGGRCSSSQAESSPRSQSALHTEISFPARIGWPGRWQHKPAIQNAQPAWMCGCPTQSLCPSACHRAACHFSEAGSLVTMLRYQNSRNPSPCVGRKRDHWGYTVSFQGRRRDTLCQFFSYP